MQSSTRGTLTQEETARAEQFETTFIAVEQELRRRIGDHNGDLPFHDLLTKFMNHYRGWLGEPDEKELRALVKVRNVNAHNRRSLVEYLAIPSTGALSALEGIANRLLRPLAALEYLKANQKSNLNVKTVQPTTSVAELLALVEEHEFTQFPVYSDTGFEGLVTSNGLTYWLIQENKEVGLVDFTEKTVSEVLPLEERRDNCEFASRTEPLVEALSRFAKNVELEAVIFTHSGKTNEKPLAIITDWDVVRLQHLV